MSRFVPELNAAQSRPPRGQPWWVGRFLALTITLIYGGWAWALLTNFDLAPVAHEKLGQVFPDMARRLLAWDFSAGPSAIQFEAFIRGGVTYAFYGIFPALLRMPFLAWHPVGADLARLSCMVALTIAVYGYVRLMQASVEGCSNALLAAAVIGAVAASGPQIYVLASASLYHELVFWSAACTAIFQLIVVRRWLRGQELAHFEYYVLALLAGCCLLCRIPDALGLYLGLLLLMVRSALCRLAFLPRGARFAGVRQRPGWLLSLAGAGCVALMFVVVLAVVNSYRWGSPFETSPYQLYSQYIGHPDELERISKHGLFSWVRVGMATAYYGTGLKLEAVMPALFADYYGSVEGPRAIVPMLAPLLFVLATIGVIRFMRRPGETLVPGLVAAGGLVGIAIMLGFLALCLRYTFDGWGLLVMLAAVGVRAVPAGRPRLVGGVALLLLCVGVAGSHLMLLRYKIVYSGTDPEVRYSLSRQIQPLLCPRAVLTPNVKLTDFNPLVTPNCPPLW